jgi:hypothetical protein
MADFLATYARHQMAAAAAASRYHPYAMTKPPTTSPSLLNNFLHPTTPSLNPYLGSYSSFYPHLFNPNRL